MREWQALAPLACGVHPSLVSRSSQGPKADGFSASPSISATGRFVAFSSRAANLPGGDGSTFRIYRFGPR